jgi:hypothetical protein
MTAAVKNVISRMNAVFGTWNGLMNAIDPTTIEVTIESQFFLLTIFNFHLR